jgi:hypothetical protein
MTSPGFNLGPVVSPHIETGCQSQRPNWLKHRADLLNDQGRKLSDRFAAALQHRALQELVPHFEKPLPCRRRFVVAQAIVKVYRRTLRVRIISGK